MMYKVSLIVPIYGVERYIRQFAESALGQTYDDMQFVFVNDGTKDRSMEILQELIDEKYSSLKSRIVIINKENGGLPSARKAGLDVAEGEYILFADSDDWLDTDAVMKVMADGVFALEGKKLLCAVANGGFYGGGYHPLPDASPIDGYMDVCMVENVSRLRFVSLIGKYKKGTHIIPQTQKIIKLLHCRSLCIEFPEPRSVSLDGELVEMSRCELEMIPGALTFVLPQGSELKVAAASDEAVADEKAKV